MISTYTGLLRGLSGMTCVKHFDQVPVTEQAIIVVIVIIRFYTSQENTDLTTAKPNRNNQHVTKA